MKRSGPLRRRKRLSPVSSRRRRDLSIYSRERAAFLAARPTCAVCRSRPSRDVHHSAGRLGGAYLDTTTWVAVCRRCHDQIHQHPSTARSLGLLK